MASSFAASRVSRTVRMVGLQRTFLRLISLQRSALSTPSAPSLKRRHASLDDSDPKNVDPNILEPLNKRKRADFGDDVTTSKRSALSTPSAPSLKRRHASLDDSDSENVDPNILESLNKRKRADIGDDVTTSKSARYSLTTIPTPPLDTSKVAAPASAPAAAGRSPTRSKHRGTLLRKRFAPPQFSTKSALHLSIATALSEALVHKSSMKIRTIEESTPKSWSFDIYEETEEQQEYAVDEWTMMQSATVLDISDDESKVREDRADRGKENVPPSDVPAPSGTASRLSASSRVPSSRKDMMTDEPRTPLGDLNVTDYYPEGLDASSVVLVQDDVTGPENESSVEQVVVPEMPIDFTFETETVAKPERFSNTVDLSSLLASSVPSVDSDNVGETDDKSAAAQELADIEIWESESAKDEKEEAWDSIFAI
jgi:hypothetical protein